MKKRDRTIGLRRKPLKPEQAEEAGRLKTLWRRYELQPGRKNQFDFANDYGLGTTQGLVWQYVNGTIPINLEAAIRFCRGLSDGLGEVIGLDQLSPRLFETLKLLPSPPLSGDAYRLGAAYDALPEQQKQTMRAVLRECERAASHQDERPAARKNTIIKTPTYEGPDRRIPKRSQVGDAKLDLHAEGL